MKIEKIKYNTFFMCLYLNTFFILAILKKININVPLSFFVFILSVFIGIFHLKIKKFFLIAFIFIVILFLNISYYYKINNNMFYLYLTYLAHIIVYIYFSSVNISIKYFRRYLSKFSIFSFFILIYLILDKRLYYSLRLTYMTFGYNCLVITTFLAYLYYKTFKYKYLFMTIISAIILFLYGSRFSFLLGIVCIISFFYFASNKIIKNFYKLGSIFLIFFFIYLKEILELILKILEKWNISITSVIRFYRSFLNVKNGAGILGERKIWYNETLNLINNFPLFGTGLLGYIGKISKNLYSGKIFYPHNIFLEILMHFGIVGLFIFFLLIFFIIKKIYIKRKQGYKIDEIYFVFIILSLKLLLSNSYLVEKWFWFILLIPFNNSYYKRCYIQQNKKVTSK